MKKNNNKVFIVGDTHFPFHSKEAYTKLMNAIKLEKPTVVIQIGDLLDQYIFSRYPRSMKIQADKDFDQGIIDADQFWKDISKIVPKARKIQLLGNHDTRLSKIIMNKLPELETFLNVKEIYTFKGVEVMSSDRDFVEIDGVVYCHGWLSKSIDHTKYFGKPVVHGHSHRPSITFDNPRLWSMDVGFLADKTSLPLQYTASKHSKWTMGSGVVENGKPRLIILE